MDFHQDKIGSQSSERMKRKTEQLKGLRSGIWEPKVSRATSLVIK
jgi:hypothetical protein